MQSKKILAIFTAFSLVFAIFTFSANAEEATEGGSDTASAGETADTLTGDIGDAAESGELGESGESGESENSGINDSDTNSEGSADTADSTSNEGTEDLPSEIEGSETIDENVTVSEEAPTKESETLPEETAADNSEKENTITDTTTSEKIPSEENTIHSNEATNAVEPSANAATEADVTEENSEISLNGQFNAYIFGYQPIVHEDGTYSIVFGGDDAVTNAQVCTMLVRLIDQDAKYANAVNSCISAEDIKIDETNWYARGYLYINAKGGIEIEDDFPKETDIKRSEVAKYIALGLNLKEGTDSAKIFSDVTAKTENKQYIDMVVKSGYMTGDNFGMFCPDSTMTRAEFCAMFNKITGRNGENFMLVDLSGNEITPDTYSIIDVTPEQWYYNDILKATSSFTKDGYVDLTLRASRENLDGYTK